MSYLVPTVIEQTSRGERSFDLYSRLLSDRARLRIEELLSEHTGQTIERVSADIERDYILRGEDAVAYGLVDAVITRRERVRSPMAAVSAPGYSPSKVAR